MAVTRRLLRPSLMTLAVIWGASLMAAGTAQGKMAGGGACDPQMAPACTVRPEACTSGCCPSRSDDLHRADADAAVGLAGAPAPRPACNPAPCQCRPAEPASPDPTSDRRTTDEKRTEAGGWSLPAWRVPTPSRSPATFLDSGGAGRLRLPLYVLTTHLRF